MRWTALTELFRYCGDIAAAYTHQNRAVVALVEDVAEVYHAERYALRHPLKNAPRSHRHNPLRRLDVRTVIEAYPRPGPGG